MYREEAYELVMKSASLSLTLISSDLCDVEQVEALAEKTQEVELAANALSNALMGLAHFLEEVMPDA